MENKKHTVVVTCLVRNDREQVLMIRHVRRGWELPQGRVETGESFVAAVHREVLEETGAEIELGPLAAVWSKVCQPPALIFGFVGRYRTGELTPSEESPEVAWLSPEEALARVDHRVNRDRLETLFNHSGNIVHYAYESRPFRVLESVSIGVQAPPFA